MRRSFHGFNSLPRQVEVTGSIQIGRLGADQRLARQMPTCSPLRVSIEPSSQHLTPVSLCVSSAVLRAAIASASFMPAESVNTSPPKITYRRPRRTRRVGLFFGRRFPEGLPYLRNRYDDSWKPGKPRRFAYASARNTVFAVIETGSNVRRRIRSGNQRPD